MHFPPISPRSFVRSGKRASSAYLTIMNQIHYRDANEGDAEALAALFSDTFRETFGHLYKPTDLAAFLSEHSAGHWQE